MAGKTILTQKLERSISERVLKPKEWGVEVLDDVDDDRDEPEASLPSRRSPPLRPTRAADDFETIRQRMEELRRECNEGVPAMAIRPQKGPAITVSALPNPKEEHRMATLIAKPTDPRRVQFDILPDRLAEFEQLMEWCDLRTRKDLFDNAMTLIEWAVDEVRKGNQITSYNPTSDHVEVIRLPVLDNAARRAKSRPIELVPTEDATPAVGSEGKENSMKHHPRGTGREKAIGR